MRSRFMARRITGGRGFAFERRCVERPVAKVASFPASAAMESTEVTAPWSEERALLAAIRAGDRDAAEEMVERTYSAVYASLYRLCGEGDLAADLTQETF